MSQERQGQAQGRQTILDFALGIANILLVRKEVSEVLEV